MQEKRFGAFTSSVDPEQFSKTWESLIKIIGVAVTTYAAFQGIDAAPLSNQVSDIVQSMTLIGSSLYAIYQSGEFIFGAIRKIFARY